MLDYGRDGGAGVMGLLVVRGGLLQLGTFLGGSEEAGATVR
jgi:hypothetical protein